MSRMKWVVIIILLFNPYAFAAEHPSSDFLIEQCLSAINEQGEGAKGYCQGFLDGFNDAHEIIWITNTELGKEVTKYWCLPESITTDKLAKFMVDYMRGKSQEELNNVAAVHVLNAYSQIYPCK